MRRQRQRHRHHRFRGTQAGDITVANDVTWTSGSTLTLSAYRNIAVNANVNISGQYGSLVCEPTAPVQGLVP